MLTDSAHPRRLSPPEKALVERLLEQSEEQVLLPLPLDQIEIKEMEDGGMGSFYFVHPTKNAEDRCFGRRIAELQYVDSDGIPILASLNVDRDGDLLEVDVWKVDFSAVAKLEPPALPPRAS